MKTMLVARALEGLGAGHLTGILFAAVLPSDVRAEGGAALRSKVSIH